MKGYSLKRYSYNVHWSMSWSETIYYFPQSFPSEDLVLYVGNYTNDRMVAGVSKMKDISNDLKKYCAKCLSGEILKGEEHESQFYFKEGLVEYSDFKEIDIPHLNFDVIKEIEQKQQEIAELEKKTEELNYVFLKKLKNEYGIS